MVLILGSWFWVLPYILNVRLSPEKMVAKQLTVSVFSSRSVWDQALLAQEPILREKLMQFERGNLCKSLKHLDNKRQTYQQMKRYLKEGGFKCIVRPLSVNPDVQPLSYLKVDNTITPNAEEEGVTHQEICWDILQPACVIRIKKEGFPLNRRSAPHSSKAVLIAEKGDPGNYAHEAFKVTAQGQALPKGPLGKFGLKKCPYDNDQKFCEQWVDAVMAEAHPILNQ
ncbi:MAG: hypothetical protein ACOH2E_07455 [Candidatus Paracaedibacter sp.]